MMPTSITSEQCQAARRKLVQQVEQGAPVSGAWRLCPIPIHRTTVYRPLKRIQREDAHAFINGRHRCPVKLRGEILAFLTDDCQSHPSASSPELQSFLVERFGLGVEHQSTEPGASCSWFESPVGATRKKPKTGMMIASGFHEQAGGFSC